MDALCDEIWLEFPCVYKSNQICPYQLCMSLYGPCVASCLCCYQAMVTPTCSLWPRLSNPHCTYFLYTLYTRYSSQETWGSCTVRGWNNHEDSSLSLVGPCDRGVASCLGRGEQSAGVQVRRQEELCHDCKLQHSGGGSVPGPGDIVQVINK